MLNGSGTRVGKQPRGSDGSRWIAVGAVVLREGCGGDHSRRVMMVMTMKIIAVAMVVHMLMMEKWG